MGIQNIWNGIASFYISVINSEDKTSSKSREKFGYKSIEEKVRNHFWKPFWLYKMTSHPDWLNETEAIVDTTYSARAYFISYLTNQGMGQKIPIIAAIVITYTPTSIYTAD